MVLGTLLLTDALRAASWGEFGPEVNPPTGPSNTACGAACIAWFRLAPSSPLAPLRSGLPDPERSPLSNAPPFSELEDPVSYLPYGVSWVPSGWSRPLDNYLDLCAVMCSDANKD
jgi:hypothetical protein